MRVDLVGGHPLFNISSEPPSAVDYSCIVSDNEILVKCGSVVGTLYLDKLIGGRAGSSKCIHYSSQNKWVSPIEFESLGGKAKSGKWKQSIKTSDNVAIATFV